MLTIAGAIIVLGTLALLAGLFFWKGPTRIDAGRSGRSIARYSWLERFNHWMVATSFVILGLTGLNITFGVYVLRPVIGPEAFTALTWWGQAAHQFLSFPFVIGLPGMLAVWARDNWPTRVDVAWVKAGGPLAKGHPPAGRFNAAQKALFWFQVGGGAVAAVSGYLLMAPALLDNITDQQAAHFIHGAMAMVLIAVILGHIYIGTIGTEGAFEAMSTGRVDFNYAREHHSVWVEEQLGEARRTVGRRRMPGRRGRLTAGQPAASRIRSRSSTALAPHPVTSGGTSGRNASYSRKPVRLSSSGSNPAASASIAARTSASRSPKARAT